MSTRGCLTALVVATLVVVCPACTPASTDADAPRSVGPVADLTSEVLETSGAVTDRALVMRLKQASTGLDTDALERLLTACAQLRGTTRAHLTTLRWATEADLSSRHSADVGEEERRFAHELATWSADAVLDEFAGEPEVETVYDANGQPVPLDRLARSSSDLQDLTRVMWRVEELWLRETGEQVSFADAYLAPHRESISRASRLGEAARTPASA